MKRTEIHNLATVKPDLADEWHPERNGNLTPLDISPVSGKKVWWRCRKGHEWEATVNNRSKGQGCPYCAGKRPTKDNNLLVVNPELVAEWHPEKNGTLTPEQLTPSSSKKVWWKCNKGHEWQSTVNNRIKRRCPFCANKVVGDDNNLAKLRPDLLAEWHPIKNLDLLPSDLTPGSGKRVWWKCRYGHEWQTAVVNRTGLNTGCPKCSPQSSRLEIQLYAELSELLDDVVWRTKVDGIEADILLPAAKVAIEVDGHYWHQKKDLADRKKIGEFAKRGITLLRVRESPLKKISRHDVIFHSKDSPLSVACAVASELAQLMPDASSREKLASYIEAGVLVAKSNYLELLSQFPGPAEGKSLQEVRPEIALQWHPTKNEALLPSMVSVGSSMKVWWQCDRGHEWLAIINQRTGDKSYGCPYCSGRRASNDRNFATEYPLLTAEWHPERNGSQTPSALPPHSGKKYWWRCNKGHEWEATVDNRTRGKGCPYCAGTRLVNERSFAVVCPELLSQLHPTRNANFDPTSVSAGSDLKVWWQCSKGHEWQATIVSRKSGTGCPYCSGNKVAPGESLAAKYPNLLEEWDLDRNLPLTPDRVTSGSGLKVWWICKQGHSWNAVINTRVKGHGCPECARTAKRQARALSLDQVILWVMDHHKQTGKWPTQYSGAVLASPKESWSALDQALRHGYRGLPIFGSLSSLIKQQLR